MSELKNITKRDKLLITKYLNQTFQMLLEGESETLVKMSLFEMSQKDKTTLDEINKIYNEGKKLLSTEYNRDKEFVVSSHVNRYNNEIKRLFDIDVSDYNKWKGIEMKTNAYFNLLEVLQQKEKVLGLHSKAIHIKVNNEVEVKAKKLQPSLELQGLTFKEKVELMHLLEESEVDREDLSIIPNDEVRKVETEDIDYTEVEEELPNIINITQDRLEDRKEVQEDIKKKQDQELRDAEEYRKRTQVKNIDLLQQNLLRAALKGKK